MEDIPKGFTPAKFINRSKRRGIIAGKLVIDSFGQLVQKKTINCRSLKNRKTYRTKVFGRVLPNPIVKKKVEPKTEK